MVNRSPVAALARTVLVLAGVAALSSGCAYRLGSTLPPGIRSVHVPTFVNETNEPELESVTTQAAVTEFQRDGTLRIVDATQADTVLLVSVTDFVIAPIKYDRDRAKRVNEYRIRIKASIRFEQADTGEVLLGRSVEGESTFESTGDLAGSKRESLPEAARDLAHDIVESVVEYW